MAGHWTLTFDPNEAGMKLYPMVFDPDGYVVARIKEDMTDPDAPHRVVGFVTDADPFKIEVTVYGVGSHPAGVIGMNPVVESNDGAWYTMNVRVRTIKWGD